MTPMKQSSMKNQRNTRNIRGTRRTRSTGKPEAPEAPEAPKRQLRLQSNKAANRSPKSYPEGDYKNRLQSEHIRARSEGVRKAEDYRTIEDQRRSTPDTDHVHFNLPTIAYSSSRTALSPVTLKRHLAWHSQTASRIALSTASLVVKSFDAVTFFNASPSFYASIVNHEHQDGIQRAHQLWRSACRSA